MFFPKGCHFSRSFWTGSLGQSLHIYQGGGDLCWHRFLSPCVTIPCAPPILHEECLVLELSLRCCLCCEPQLPSSPLCLYPPGSEHAGVVFENVFICCHSPLSPQWQCHPPTPALLTLLLLPALGGDGGTEPILPRSSRKSQAGVTACTALGELRLSLGNEFCFLRYRESHSLRKELLWCSA